MSLLLYLADVSIRAIPLASLAGAGLWIFRVRSASRKHAVWTLVLFAMLAAASLHPLLPAIPLRVLRALPTPAPLSISLPFPPIFRLAADPPPRALDPVTL